jgi:hypothetical protein
MSEISCKVEKYNNLVVLEFASTKDMMEAVYRFSHHHEYPEWRNRDYFTTRDLDNHYIKLYNDKDWWKSKWAGANLTDKDVNYFVAKNDTFNEYEQVIVDAVKDIKGPFRFPPIFIII